MAKNALYAIKNTSKRFQPDFVTALLLFLCKDHVVMFPGKKGQALLSIAFAGLFIKSKSCHYNVITLYYTWPCNKT